jgi:hypothetical protein
VKTSIAPRPLNSVFDGRELARVAIPARAKQGLDFWTKAGKNAGPLYMPTFWRYHQTGQT